MKLILIPLIAISAYLGVNYAILAATYLAPLKIATELTYVAQDYQPAEQTKVLPDVQLQPASPLVSALPPSYLEVDTADVQLQPALAVQGTVGIE